MGRSPIRDKNQSLGEEGRALREVHDEIDKLREEGRSLRADVRTLRRDVKALASPDRRKGGRRGDPPAVGLTTCISTANDKHVSTPTTHRHRHRQSAVETPNDGIDVKFTRL